ncbi:chemotaxis protein CheA [Thaumasiovibrio subtropicus]|uniref:chemotaxis protein CheA n=1 Tax=Thaumasiovibrio subtropicus TaxID=1891207 RepID=UPI000B34BB8B|nr:chemotaxis protein CheA [Thaumasiovibrio subtropicus]
MALDMNQLRKMFFEECRENLEVLETELLGIQPENVDPETINTIFRAAHSIKGGAATFNLLDISEFTHAMEAYLDEVRNEKLSLTSHSVDVLLRGGDCIKEMLVGHENDAPVDPELRSTVTNELKKLLESDTDSSSTESAPVEDSATVVDQNAPRVGWHVNFLPHQDLFFSGNDPLRIIGELLEIDASAEVVCDSSKLPPLAGFEAELCYLSWQVNLDGMIEEDAIKEIFEWVEDQCDLHITPQYGDLESAQTDTATAAEPEAVVEKTVSTEPQPMAESASVTKVAEKTPEKATAEDKPQRAAKADSSVSSIRVDIDKVDNLINLVGELVITQSMLTEIGNDFSNDKIGKLKSGLDQLLQNTKELQENVLNIRMLPMSFAFSRFPRLVRDLSSRLEKQVNLVISGEHTELDKTVLERIVDPLVHLVRNGIDHGLELPDVRTESGKDPMGTISLNAYHQGGAIVIEVKDDGAGIDCDRLWNKAMEKGVVSSDMRREEMTDKQVLNLIFAPGFSTANEVSDISGRGVGMDVVRRNIEELGGHIEVESAVGVGSSFTISLPLTLAILDGQLVKVAGEVYVIPLITIVESIQIDTQCVKLASGGIELYRLREENIPILRLHEEFGLGESGSLDGRLLCLVEAAGNRIGLLLDELLGQQQVVIKSLESNYTKVSGISGATILGDGSVSLILDIQGLITAFKRRQADGSSGGIAA